MSPWWSRPTADDIPDRADDASGEFDADVLVEEGGAASLRDAAANLADEPEEEEEEGKATSRRRPRRRRRSSTAVAASEAEESEKAPEGKAKKSERGEGAAAKDTEPEESTPAPRRRRSRRSEPSKISAGEAKKEPSAKSEDARKPAKDAKPGKDSKPAKPSKPSKPSKAAKAAEPAEEPAAAAVSLPPLDLERVAREIVITLPERAEDDERKIALFCDLENVALGVRDSSDVHKFDIHLVLERLLEKGKIIVKKAYCDWERYNEYKRAFHEAAIEMIDIPQKYYSGKNSADIKMVVDAMDLSYSKEHLDTFVLLSGDSDFSPLVSKLKENNKYVIGVGVKNSSSNLLIDNCDEFLYYEDIWRDSQGGPQLDGLSKKAAEAFGLMVDAIQALIRENKEVLWGSMVKQTMQRKKPSFNEGYYGYGSFSELLEDAQRHQIVSLKKDQRSGSYIVKGFAQGK